MYVNVFAPLLEFDTGGICGDVRVGDIGATNSAVVGLAGRGPAVLTIPSIVVTCAKKSYTCPYDGALRSRKYQSNPVLWAGLEPIHVKGEAAIWNY
jgi:hypothetical protein